MAITLPLPPSSVFFSHLHRRDSREKTTRETNIVIQINLNNNGTNKKKKEEKKRAI